MFNVFGSRYKDHSTLGLFCFYDHIFHSKTATFNMIAWNLPLRPTKPLRPLSIRPFCY